MWPILNVHNNIHKMLYQLMKITVNRLIRIQYFSHKCVDIELHFIFTYENIGTLQPEKWPKYIFLGRGWIIV